MRLHSPDAFLDDRRELGLGCIRALDDLVDVRRLQRVGKAFVRDGGETEAHLRLPPPNLESELEDWVVDQYGLINYSVKEQVKQFVDAVAHVQEIREGVRKGRHKSAS